MPAERSPERNPECVVETRELIASRVVRIVTNAAPDAIRERGVFTLAIPGGSVAEAVLPLLTRAELAWKRVHLFWCDERAVPLSNPDSNAGAALRMLEGSPLANGATMHVVHGDAADLEHEAEAYSRALENIAGNPPVLDVVLLGVGEDGHVASLFPGHASLGETSRAVLVETEATKPPPQRLSLTLPVLTGARQTIVASFGKGKAEAMRQALEVDDSMLPVALVLQRSRRAHVLLDADAASLLHHEAAR